MTNTECVGNKSDDCVIDPCLVDGWSSLHYVDVEVEGLSCPLSALQDSGCAGADLRGGGGTGVRPPP